MQAVRASGDLDLEVVSVPCEASGAYRDGIRALHAGELGALVLSGVYAPDVLSRVVERLETEAHPFPTITFPPHNLGAILGPCIDLCGPDLDGYLDGVDQARRSCAAVFREAVPFEDRVPQVLSPIASGLPVRLLEKEGRPYSPATIRRLEPRGFVKLHTEDEKIDQPQKQHLASIAKPGILSFYMTLQPAASGGELVLHELRWPDYHGPMFKGRSDAARDVEGRPRKSLALDAGELVVFGHGRFHEVSEVGPGRTRWTIGGFLALGAKDEAVYFYS
ncbi:MAG: 2OG-Fe(II) oxygenase [Sandaracinaceae bacterium]|nr:2OG-Fe(II) oxygenase [Sandaracinaceae bacterium]